MPPQTFVKDTGGAFPAEVQLTDADAGLTIGLAKDGTLIIALSSNPSTGFSWAVTGVSPGIMRQEGEPRFVPPGSTEPVVGAPGTEVFTFTAVEQGTATLELVYKRPWEDIAPEKAFSVEVNVR